MSTQISKYRTAKGEGNRTSLQLSSDQKVALTLWIHKNKNLCEAMSSAELAEKFQSETRIKVSTSSILTTRNAVFPSMKKTRNKDGQPAFDINLIIEKMNQLNSRLSKIESELGILSL
jgi:hypothetical protein